MIKKIIKTRENKRRQRGMTLVELMFAAGILTFVLSMIFTSVISVGVNREIHTQRLQAESAVNDVLDQISRMDASQILSFQPDVVLLPGNSAVLQIEAVVSDGSTINIPSVNGAVTLPNPVEIRVILSWQTDRGYTITKRASTYVSY
ncbi:MAG TPA: type II secretion system protein [Candidatus Hydrogenedens sp.]|nr:type II secretion system protein [Candidatus Hydrogenedens sp.]